MPGLLLPKCERDAERVVGKRIKNSRNGDGAKIFRCKEKKVQTIVETVVKSAVMNEDVRESVAIVEEKRFSALRHNEMEKKRKEY